MASGFDSAWKASGLDKLVNKTKGAASSLAKNPVVSKVLGMLGLESSVKALAGAAAAAGSSSTRRDHDPYGDFNFRIEINGLGSGAFQKCDGLSFEMDEIVYRESGDRYPRKRPGLRRFGSIRLTRGHIDNTDIWAWCKELIGGKIDRRDGSLHLRSDDGTDEVSYTLTGMIPVKWQGMKIDGKGDGCLVEELELAVECISKA
jgi:phage tail-like protein